MLVGRELNARCFLSGLTVSDRSNRPSTWSSCSIRRRMRESLVGPGVPLPSPPFRFPYVACKPITAPSERCSGSAECDLVRWVTVVFTLGAEARNNVSPPSSCCYSMVSYALGSEDMFIRLLNGKLMFLFLCTLPVSQSLGLSVFRHYSTRHTTPDLFHPRVRSKQSPFLPTADIRLAGLRV